MDGLRPCPFCGGEAYINPKTYSPTCTKCQATIPSAKGILTMTIKILVEILLITILASSLFSLLVLRIWYNKELPYEHERCPKIKLSDFEKWYRIAPDKWWCQTGYGQKNYQPCYFSFFDFLCYQVWRKRNYKRAQKKIANRNLKEVLESVQDDIEDFKEKIDNEIEEAYKDAEEIKRRLIS